MDVCGVGNTVIGAAEVAFAAARVSGRTTTMINMVKDGDRVVFLNQREANRVDSLLRERGIKAHCIVASPTIPEEVYRLGTPRGRLIFDHSWVEEYYRRTLHRSFDALQHLSIQGSGWGEAHETTRRQAIEIARWGVQK